MLPLVVVVSQCACSPARCSGQLLSAQPVPPAALPEASQTESWTGLELWEMNFGAMCSVHCVLRSNWGTSSYSVLPFMNLPGYLIDTSGRAS